MTMKKVLFGVSFALSLLTNTASAASCDPINTYCQSVTTQACELTEDVVKTVADYICILVPDPKWYNPGNMKKKCLTEYKDQLIKGTSTCSNVTGLSCPSVTGSSSLTCDTAMNVVSSCLKGNTNSCTQAHVDAAIAITFGQMCSTYTIYQSGLLESSYETRLYNMVDSALDNEIRAIFGGFLGDTSFDDYVRGTVAFYKTSNTAMDVTVTPNSTYRGKTTPGKIFFNTTNPPKDLIIHELVHIWQYRNRGVQAQTAAACADVFNLGLLDQYKFSLVPGKKFSDYGVEQQAQIVQNYYLYKNGMKAGCSADDFQNCSSYSNDSARILALKNTIAGTSSTSLPGAILFYGSCSGSSCEGPGRDCYSRNGTLSVNGPLSINGSNYICYAK